MIAPKARTNAFYHPNFLIHGSSICTFSFVTRPVDGDTATFGDVILSSYSLVPVLMKSLEVGPCVLALCGMLG